MDLPIYTAPATDKLCREIAKQSKGVCFLAFSRGKDSLCAWLNLLRYFKRVIPVHFASCPHIQFVDKTLEYYEYEFQTHIIRMMGEDLRMAMRRLVYQEPDEAEETYARFEDVEDYSKLTVIEYLRKEYNLPRAWCAYGISASDSIDRRIYCNQTGGKSDINRSFYPCWDWPRHEILDAIRLSSLKLAPDYKYTKRSMGGVPSAGYNKVLKEHFPQGYEQLKRWYPIMDAKNYRARMIKEAAFRAREAKVLAMGGKKLKKNAATPEKQAVVDTGEILDVGESSTES